jgi:Eukaryotic rRNA processing protein EBP2
MCFLLAVYILCDTFYLFSYKQALHGANAARSLAAKHSLAFTRPPDYFAEMVKTDAHMERIRQRLLDEGANIKRSEEKRKEREGKKFGKQVQMEKLKERERSKKDMEERLKSLKRSTFCIPFRLTALSPRFCSCLSSSQQ